MDMAEELTLSEAIASYLRSVKPEERAAAAQELNRFARWYGSDRPLRRITPADLERYQEQLGSSSGDPSRLAPLRSFFTDARQRKLLDQPLAAHIRIRRRGNARTGNGASVAGPVELTQTGYEQLQAELERLEKIEQPRAREELQRAAADKDFRENAPYDAAKQHLADLQRRINEIRAMLSNCTIVPEGYSDRIRLGTTVVVRDLDENERLRYTLVGPGEIDPRNGKISIQSPVGRALNDQTVGATVNVETPSGVMRLLVEEIVRE